MPSFGPDLDIKKREFNAAVNAERDRRVGTGFYYKEHKFDFDPQTKERITGAGALAIAAIMNGAQIGDLLWAGGTEPFTWVLQDNTYLPLDAHDMLAVSSAAAAHERSHVFHGISIKSQSPQPHDHTVDSLWPTIAPVTA